MRCQLFSEDFRITPAVRSKIDDEVTRLMRYLPDRASDSSDIKVTIGRWDKNSFAARLGFRSGRWILHAHSASSDLYCAISRAFGILVRRLRTRKERRIGKRKDEIRAGAAA